MTYVLLEAARIRTDWFSSFRSKPPTCEYARALCLFYIHVTFSMGFPFSSFFPVSLPSQVYMFFFFFFFFIFPKKKTHSRIHLFITCANLILKTHLFFSKAILSRVQIWLFHCTMYRQVSSQRCKVLRTVYPGNDKDTTVQFLTSCLLYTFLLCIYISKYMCRYPNLDIRDVPTLVTFFNILTLTLTLTLPCMSCINWRNPSLQCKCSDMNQK